MKYIYTFILILTFATISYSQYDIRAGMGISFGATPSLTDYLNQNFEPSNQQLGIFGSAIVFSGEGGYLLNNHYEIGVELAYLINSYNLSYDVGNYRLSYNILMPTLVNYYVIKGQGYDFKFGGGVGPRFVSVNQQLPGTISGVNFTSTGFGFLVRADGNTTLGGDLYANIGVDLRYDFNGKPKNGSTYIHNNVYNQDVNFNSLSATIRLGVSYIF